MAVLTTPTSAPAWRLDVRGIPASNAIPEALVLLCSSIAGVVEGDEPSVRVPYVEDEPAGFVPEGAVIPEVTPILSEVTIHTGKVSQLIRVSRELYGQADTATLLTDSVRRAVTNAANVAFLQQAAPVGPAVTPPPGLLNITGVEDGGAVASSLDALVDAETTIATNGGTATHIIASPSAWAALSKLKQGTGSNMSILGSPATATWKTLLGIPVVVSSAMTEGGLLMIDKTAVVSAVGQVMVTVSDQFFFSSDSLASRCTFRFGANVVRPNRVVSLTA